MPPKRKTNEADGNPASSVSSAPAKRQRVSRACDQCRNAREKCDGIQPQCFSCVSLDRECTYNEPIKKRGVQTGLIRTLESALYWVFERHPGTEAALNDLLAQESGRESLSIGKRNEAGNRLHQKWRKSKTHKEIGRLLSGKENSPRNEPSDEDDSGTEPDANQDAEGASGNPRPQSKSSKKHARNYQLPHDVSRLLDIYFTYTHPWLPIVDKGRLLALSATSPSQAVKDPEIWAVIAIASAQDPTDQSQDRYAIARSLLPLIGEEQPDVYPEYDMHLHIVNAFVLLSLIHLGQDDGLTASLLVGMAVRTLLARSTPPPAASGANTQATRTIMGCFLLDSLVSLRLGQVPHLIDTTMVGMAALPEEGPEEWETWSGIPDFTMDERTLRDATTTMRPTQSLSSFNQLCRFARVINRRSAGQSASPGSSDLAAALDSRFSFCNSILDNSTPALPTALLLQTTFLGATIALSPNGRVSLLWTFMEAVEHSWQQLGPGASPLLVTYMSIANSRTKSLGGEDKDRWDALLAKLKSTWQSPSITPSATQRNDTNGAPVQPAPRQQDQTPMTAFDGFQPPGGRYFGPPTATSPSTARSMPFTPGNSHLQGMHGGNGMSPLIHMPPLLSFHGHPELMMDHDNILDELASFDCADNMDTDPQFMANLGFAPGSDYPDMRGDFGPM